MKLFLGAWIGTLLGGWLLLTVFVSFFGNTGLLLLAVTVVAVLIAVIAALSNEVDDLRKQLEKLEAADRKQEDRDGKAGAE